MSGLPQLVQVNLGVEEEDWDALQPQHAFVPDSAPIFIDGVEIAELSSILLRDKLSQLRLKSEGDHPELVKRLRKHLIKTKTVRSSDIIDDFSRKSDQSLIFLNKKPPDKSGKLALVKDQLLDCGTASTEKALFIINNTDEAISSDPSIKELQEKTQFGVIQKSSLRSLYSMIEDVFIPLLDPGKGGSFQDLPPTGETGSSDTHELLVNMNKFGSQIKNAIRQVDSEINLPIPQFRIELTKENLEERCQNRNVIEELQRTLQQWEQVFQECISKTQSSIRENCHSKRQSRSDDIHCRKSKINGYISAQGPMTEINFWTELNAMLSGVWEQLITDRSKLLLKAMEITQPLQKWQHMESNLKELSKLYVEAKDNVQFLSTLDRYFKNIESSNLGSILEIIPSMMNALRMIWIVSRHYNTEERMLPLMDLIAVELAEKVSENIDMYSVLALDSADAMHLITTGKSVLEQWSKSYHHQKEQIFESCVDRRWEFDRKILFEQTNYMIRICNDLHSVVETLGQFNQILGPQLKGVTKDINEIDRLTQKVQIAKRKLEGLPYNMFDRRYSSSWEQIMKEFKQAVLDIEQQLIKLIDNSFQNLRTAETAFDMLQDFKNMQCRKSIQDQMMQKFSDILKHFCNEIDLVKGIFDEEKMDPPICKHHPPVAGRIHWCRNLYFRIKHVVIRFQEAPGLYECEEFESVRDKYLAVAMEMVKYEEDAFSEWCVEVESIVDNALKESLLQFISPLQPKKSLCPNTQRQYLFGCIKIDRHHYKQIIQTIQKFVLHKGSGLQFSNPSLFEEINSANLVLDDGKYLQINLNSEFWPSIFAKIELFMNMHSIYTLRIDEIPPRLVKIISLHIEEMIALENGFNIEVNFETHLTEIITETKYLEKMGFKIPQLAQKVSLQETKYHEYVHVLTELMLEYSTTLSNLKPFERQALRKQFKLLYQNIRTGIHPLNWMSLCIPNFLERISKCLVDFKSTLSRIRQNWEQLEIKFEEMESHLLVDVSFVHAQSSIGLDALVTQLIAARELGEENMIAEYEGIPPLLNKIEEAVSTHNTGSDPNLSQLYSSVEMRVFMALRASIMKSLKLLKEFFDSNTSCAISLDLGMPSPPEMRISPRIRDVKKQLFGILQDFITMACSFTRWQEGTCIHHEPPPESDGMCRNHALYTFHEDIKSDKAIQYHMKELQKSIESSLAKANAFQETWAYYDQEYHLWDARKLKNLARQPLSLDLFEQKMHVFQKITEHVSALEKSHRVAIFRVDVAPIITEIISAVKYNKEFILNLVLKDSDELLNELDREVGKFEKDIYRETNDIDALKFVLQAIQKCQGMNMDVILRYKDIQQKYTMLESYGAEVRPEKKKKVMNFQDRWEELIFQTRKREIELELDKAKFARMTIQLVESFLESTKAIKKAFVEDGPDGGTLKLGVALERMLEKDIELQKAYAERAKLVTAQKLFGLEISPYPELAYVETQMKKLKTLFEIYQAHKAREDEWGAILWRDLDISLLEAGIQDSIQSVEALSEDLKTLNTHKKVEDCIIGFQKSIPLIGSLKNDAFRPRHWKQLMEVTGQNVAMGSNFSLQNLFDMELHKHSEKVEEIIYLAGQETKIEEKLNEIVTKWKSLSFPLSSYKDTPILGDITELEVELEDDILNIQTLSSSRFVKYFREKVAEWDKNLNMVADCVKVWLLTQQKWMYLEGIFIGSEDIRMQLKDAATEFDRVNEELISIMVLLKTDANAVKQCTSDNRLEKIRELSADLDRCQKSLSDYLQSKRNCFPRFYFISDDELLQILGSSDPSAVQDHVLKLYVNCKKLILKSNLVTGMESSEGESFTFINQCATESKVEKWMNDVQDEMKSTLHSMAKKAVFYYAKTPRIDWINENLGMLALVGTQIWWTWQVEDVFRQVKLGDKQAMKSLDGKLTSQLNDLVAQVRRTDLSRLDRKKINTLIIIDVHARDIVSRFVRDSILDATEFEWESQLRFYWDRDEDDIIIHQCTGVFRYGYEYEGLNGRLVITPLTDRCVMTLTSALTFNMGGAPAGPAGTGKTETVKDLAKSLALPCFVTNCSEGLDYRATGAIFSGLCQSGAWGCFDEFNRISLEVLSVVSAQLRQILTAVKMGVESFEFAGQQIMCNQNVGFFVTMNPGYAGRAELPDSLKTMFRPVTMIVPDMLQICEIMLFSEGFAGARILAKKMTVLYKLAQEQLSKQYHYDFGLRALKSVLIMAGALKRGSQFSEEMTLMRALRDMNTPKFVFEDVPLFLNLINDLFPGLDCPRVLNRSLKEAIVDRLDQKHFHHDDETVFNKQVDKIVQLYETMLTRHTCMVVGPTQGGKSVVIETLAESQGDAFGVPVKLFRMNPKALPVHELYGVLDPVSRDWTDGILSKIFRSCNEPLRGKKETRWILFDGDVDANWVENMNSVMDDNKLLTLPNGERIRLQDHVKMLVEVFDLQYASPATISRCGMVYVDNQDLGYLPYYQFWTQAHEWNEQQQETMQMLLRKYVDRSLEYVLEGLEGDHVIAGGKMLLITPVCAMNCIKQLCNVFDSLYHGLESPSIREDLDQMECVFVFALIWSIGAVIQADRRDQFDQFVKQLSGRSCVDGADKKKLPKSSLFENSFDVERGLWVPWSDYVHEYQPPVPFKFSKVCVPTVDTVRNNYMITKMLNIQKSILFIGHTGTAKTLNITKYLDQVNPEVFSTLRINFSSRTTSLDTQRNLMDNLEKRGPFWCPAGGKKLIVFVDDLSMPNVDIYGTQQPIALLKFLVERNIMYERDGDLNQINTRKLLWVGAMQPPGGGRNYVDPRFTSLFNIFHVVSPKHESLKRIYSSVLMEHVKPFSEEIRNAAASLTDIMLSFYNRVVASLPPTPSKFHYIFNLRDLSRVYEGLCMSLPSVIDTAPKFIRLWRNEVLRIFCDRLISDEDQTFVEDELLSKMISDAFPNCAETACQNPSLFGSYKEVNDEKNKDMIYQDLGVYSDIHSIFNDVLVKYNQSNQEMNLVLFEDALEHLTRIHRVLKIPRGNSLLVGVGGSGKQSLTRLATFAAGYKLFTITLARGYGEAEFREDLKSLYGMLGGSEPVTFLLTDAQIVDDSFLELINNMLTSGMVPALFSEDEKNALIDPIRNEVIASGIDDSKENCWNFFINKASENLHIVLAMSPGDVLRTRCRNFPGIVSNTVIDWFFPWPADALADVAKHFLKDIELPKENRDEIVKHCVRVHQRVGTFSDRFEIEKRRKIHVTPKNYLDYLMNYDRLLTRYREQNTSRAKTLQGGLNQLIKTGDQVEELQVELQEQKKVVEAKQKECQEMIEIIQKKSQIAAEKQEQALVKKKQLEEDAKQIQIDTKIAEEALAEAEPALAAAAEALKNIKRDDIAELKQFANPAESVQATCICVLNMKPTGGEDVNGGWSGAQKMMGNAQFLSSLLNYDKNKITDKMYKTVSKLIKKKPKDPTQKLTMETLNRVSQAGAGLLQWVFSIQKYYEVARDVAPRREKVKKMERMMAQSARDLKKTQAELVQIEQDIAELSKNLEIKKGELSVLEEKLEQMIRYLDSAEKLIDGLGGERTRWTKDKREIGERYECLVGDCLLASAFLSYTGPFTFSFRNEMVYEDWIKDIVKRKIPITPDFRLDKLLTTEVEISEWVSQGLPSDELSVQNGILTTQSSRFPLCIDPQMQAIKWIKERESANKLNVRTFNDSDFVKILELSITFGNPFLFENVDEELDPIIYPVLSKNIVMNNGQAQIKLGDNTLDWDRDFRLYMISKMSSPDYSPEIAGMTMIIDYSVTHQGLEDQLLDVVVGFERPDLQAQRQELIQTMSKNNIVLAELENLLLRELTEFTGNILENKTLIEVLQNAKAKSDSIKEQQVEAAKTAQELEEVASQYRPVAKRGSILFFSMSSLSVISRMYEFALGSYLKLFVQALESSKTSAAIDTRLSNIINKLTCMAYDYVCTGVFEKHKLIYSFQMATLILDADGGLNREELDFFLKGNISLADVASAKPADWIPSSGWKDIERLVIIGGEDGPFKNFVKQLESDIDVWRAWYDLERPEEEPLPSGYDELTPLQRLLILRCFRPDRVYNAARNFIINVMGTDYFVLPPVLDYRKIYDSSSNDVPIVFILSPGADPMRGLQKIAEEEGLTAKNKFKYLALGQGQADIAKRMLDMGASRGDWVVLQNCHLMPSWLRNLEKILEGDIKKKAHKDFRVFLTTEKSDNFPIGILQSSFKVVTEPPDGLKLNMKASYSRVTDVILDQCPHKYFRPLVYVLSFFHAVVQERRKYGKLGWNVNYDFNDSDYDVSLKLLSMYLTKTFENEDKMPWGSLRYLIGEAMYGGRVTDSFDRRVIVTYLEEYMGDFLFDDSQAFFFSQSGFDYKIPSAIQVEQYVKAVDKVPLDYSPEVFGLHSNAEIGYNSNATKYLWSSLIDLQPRTSSGSGGIRREDHIMNIARDIESKVPKVFDIPLTRKLFMTKYGNDPSPSTVVLFQELERWNILVSKMALTLNDLQKALKGEISMSAELDEFSNSLFNGFLPNLWRRFAPQTEKKLGSWMNHFLKRYAQYKKWIDQRQDPTVMWLSGLHIPETYLAAIIQTTCREKKWPLDKSTLYTEVTNVENPGKIRNPMDYGCYVHGLYLEGAGWDNKKGCLKRQDPKKLITELPVMKIIPIESSKLKLQNTFRTPVYVTQNRRNAMSVGLVFEADLRSFEHDSHWTLQGTALVLNTSD